MNNAPLVLHATHERIQYVREPTDSGFGSESGCCDLRRTAIDEGPSRDGEISDLFAEMNYPLGSIDSTGLYVVPKNDDGFGKGNRRRGRCLRDGDGLGGRGRRREAVPAGAGRRLATAIAVIFLVLLQTTAGE